jgi:hypothetical protein
VAVDCEIDLNLITVGDGGHPLFDTGGQRSQATVTEGSARSAA